MHADEKLTAFVELRICDSRLQRVYLTCRGDFFKTWQRQKDLNQAEIRRVLATGAQFLYTDLLPVQRWADVQVILNSLGFTIRDERHIGPNVPASCDNVAATRAQAFGDANAMIDNVIAAPGSAAYEQMKSGA